MENIEYKDIVEKNIVAVYTQDDVKYIQFYAYGYFAYEGEPLDHRFVEYSFFIVPLKEALDYKYGVYGYESEFGARCKQYIEDCDEEAMMYTYLHYDNGNCPKLLDRKDLNINTMDGVYILL